MYCSGRTDVVEVIKNKHFFLDHKAAKNSTKKSFPSSHKALGLILMNERRKERRGWEGKKEVVVEEVLTDHLYRFLTVALQDPFGSSPVSLDI